jgi:hypothetical protein
MVQRIERGALEIMRDEMVVRDEIAAFVAGGPRTIPEIASHMGYPRHEVMIWVMAMWQYGMLRDTGETDEEGYCRYELND